MYACVHSSVQVMLSKRADVNAWNGAGKTPLDLVKSQFPALIGLLEKNGGKRERTTDEDQRQHRAPTTPHYTSPLHPTRSTPT